MSEQTSHSDRPNDRPNDRHNDQVVLQFSKQADGYSRLTNKLAAGDRQAAFRDLARPKAADRALDVCCGSGAVTLDFARYVEHMTGLDLTPAMLDQAKKEQARRDIGNIDWVEGTVCPLLFDDAVFDLVLCGAAFHHLTDPKAAFREMVRVCKPGGRIVIRDVTPAADKVEAYDAIEIMRDPSHHHALTVDEMKALGEGLAVSEPTLLGSISADLPLDAVLATSFPEVCSIEDIEALLREDARSGEDRFGFDAKIVDDRVLVSYPMTSARWDKY